MTRGGAGTRPVTVVAVDLGAESGRVTTVGFDGHRLALQVVHRFSTVPRRSGGHLRWDAAAIQDQIGSGLARVAAGGSEVAAVGVDAWGVDYGLLDAGGRLIDDPISYRDGRNLAPFGVALAEVGGARLYAATGIAPMAINTLFGLMADQRDDPGRLTRAATLVMIADVFHAHLSGARVSEYSAISTSGAYDMGRGRWAVELLEELGVPTHLLPEVVPAGTDLGPLRTAGQPAALAGARVVVPAAHDTACAVVGTPRLEPGALFLSSGTWSLAGIEVAQPIIDEPARRAGLTNEGGYGGSIRLQRTMIGLWLLQECRRQWAGDGTDHSYAELAELAAAEPGWGYVVDSDAADFLAPGDMPRRIRSWCADNGLPVPETASAVARCAIDSLALSYRSVVDDLARVTGRRPTSVNVVGGGAGHALLSQLTADATGLPVRCGPIEATALGNGAVQLATLGELAGPAEIRQAVADSFPVREYEPRDSPGADQAAARLSAVTARRRPA